MPLTIVGWRSGDGQLQDGQMMRGHLVEQYHAEAETSGSEQHSRVRCGLWRHDEFRWPGDPTSSSFTPARWPKWSYAARQWPVTSGTECSLEVEEIADERL